MFVDVKQLWIIHLQLFLATCLERNKCPHSSNDFFDILINLELTFEQKLSKTLFRIFFSTARFGYSYLKKQS